MSDIEKLLSQAKEATKKGGYKPDERLWKPKRNSDGDATAIVRLLPPTNKDDKHFVSVISYFFKGDSGKYYIEKSRKTLDERDPVYEYNKILWDTGDETNRSITSRQKQIEKFYTNVLVIDDKNNPENNGKVFIWEFSRTMMTKIKNALKGDEMTEGFNPYDTEKGALLMIKVNTGSNNIPSYDNSRFGEAGNSLSDSVENVEDVLKRVYCLKEFTDPKSFKSYDELKQRLDVVIGNSNGDQQDTISDTVENASEPNSESSKEPEDYFNNL